MKEASDQAREAQALSKAIMPFLAGKDPDVQGAALADLLALYLAGHVVRDDPRATRRLQEELLEAHLKAVWELVPIAYETVIKPKLRQRRN